MITTRPDHAPVRCLPHVTRMFIVDQAANQTLPLVAITVSGGSENFLTSSSSGNYNMQPGSGTLILEGRDAIIITAQRTPLARAFTLCLLLINWTLTIGSTYVTLVVVIRGEGVHEGVLLLPVTIILTIPSLRGLYVGPPPFGIYIGRP